MESTESADHKATSQLVQFLREVSYNHADMKIHVVHCNEEKKLFINLKVSVSFFPFLTLLKQLTCWHSES